MKHIMQHCAASNISSSPYTRGPSLRGMREGSLASIDDLARAAGLGADVVEAVESDGQVSCPDRERYLNGLSAVITVGRQRAQELRQTNPRAFWARVDATLAGFDALYGPLSAA